MATLFIGDVSAGGYEAGDLIINDQACGAMGVVQDDADETLRNWFNGLDDVSASLDGADLVLEYTGSLSVAGRDPSGGGSVSFYAGTYE